jgi:hypothetical protein
MITENTINLIVAVPHFEANTFKTRKFDLCFEEKLPEGLKKTLETPPEFIKFIIRIAGLDFQIMQ